MIFQTHCAQFKTQVNISSLQVKVRERNERKKASPEPQQILYVCILRFSSSPYARSDAMQLQTFSKNKDMSHLIMCFIVQFESYWVYFFSKKYELIPCVLCFEWNKAADNILIELLQRWCVNILHCDQFFNLQQHLNASWTHSTIIVKRLICSVWQRFHLL